MDFISIRYSITESQYMTACRAHWSARGQGTRSNALAGILCMAEGIGLMFTTLLSGWISSPYATGQHNLTMQHCRPS